MTLIRQHAGTIRPAPSATPALAAGAALRRCAQLFALLAAGFAAGCASTQTMSGDARPPSDAKARAVDAFVASFVSEGGPGLALAVEQKGKILYSAGYGLADLEQGTPIRPDTRLHVASVSKQFTAFAIALLAREGKVDLDADIRTYLPYAPDFGSKITVRHLIHHTSGLRDQWELFIIGGQSYNNVLHQAQIINMVRRQRALNFPPGGAYAYSNTGYTLLAEIVEAASGMSFREFTTARIFEPLGMTDTFFFDNVEEITPGRANSYVAGRPAADGAKTWKRSLLNFDNVGATSLFTTAEDLMKWGRNFSRPTVGDAALIDQITTTGALDDGRPINYGFALKTEYFAGRRATAHFGSDAGFRALFAHFPEHDFSAAVLANTPVDREKLMAGIVAIYLGETPPPTDWATPAETEPDVDMIAALAGDYLPAYRPLFSLEEKDGGLIQRSLGLRSTKPVVFHADGTIGIDGDRFEAIRDAAGGISALTQVDDRSHANETARRLSARPELSRSALKRFAGAYRSSELDITYEVSAHEDGLRVETIWTEKPIKFAPTAPNRFDPIGYFGPITFEEDARGRIVGFAIDTPRVRGLKLERVGERPQGR